MTSKRVLFADDTEDMRLLLRIVLGQASFSIVGEATTGTEAIEMWEATADQDVFAVILDQRMPGLTGIEVARRVLADRPGQRIILFSAQVDDALRAEAAAAGITAVLRKEEIVDLANHPSLAA